MTGRIRRLKMKGISILLAFFLLPASFCAIRPMYAAAGESGQDEYIGEVAESAEPEAEKQYIVKYRDSMVFLMEDEEAPFEIVDQEERKSLLSRDALEWYEEDADMFLLDGDPAETDEESSCYDPDLQWNLEMIRADMAFRKKCLGAGVRVGVLDSGVNPHADFRDRLLKGRNFEESADTEQKQSDTSDEYGHGTRVAGLIAAAGEDGFIGAAPGAWIVPLKCTNGKTVKVSAVCMAVYSGIDDFHCDVLNLSLGTQQDNRALKEAMEYAEKQGVPVVSAVGNNGTSAVYYPAAYDTVIGVGSVTRDGVLYYHSNQNESVFVTAPGANVRSTAFRGGYADSTGCSFAVPQVAAAAAVMKGIDGSLTPARIRGILSETAMDRGREGYDTEYGYGILNLGGCVEALPESGNPSDDPNPQKDPSGDLNGPNGPNEQTDPNGQTDPDGQNTDPDGKKEAWKDCPRDESCLLNGFSDLSAGAWYHDGIHYAVEQQIMNGYEDGTFRPDVSTTRAMIVTMLWRMEETPGIDSIADLQGTPLFRDVPEGRWYTAAVRWASAEGIVNGYSEETFGPDDAVTREQLAAILWRYTDCKGSSGNDAVNTGNTGSSDGAQNAEKDQLGRFLDTEQVAGWAMDAMRWAVSTGLIQGVDEEHIRPAASASRAQTATMLMRYAGSAPRM